MSGLPDPSAVKVYTVNGAASGSSSSLPDWLTRKRAAAGKGAKRAVREQVEGTIQLIQHFEFPEASNKIKTTRDGHHAIATGTYKPQIRVWDLDQLSLKFERHSDAENVDFIMLSDDWTKSIHLQNDRTIELHTQGGLHYKTRIPKFGRALAYHFPSCDALFAASGPEIFRLNLDQGRYLAPLVLGGNGEEIAGVNCIDINPAHQLFAFGVDGRGVVELWDPRSRSRVGLLRLPQDQLLPVGGFNPQLPGIDEPLSLSVTAISSRLDGLSYAIGTSTGHTLLYDIRSARPLATKDQGYGLPVQSLSWIEGGSRMAGDGLVLSADRKVIKIWDRNSPATNFTSITPAADMNDVHHIPGSGLLLAANEGIEMTTFYIPQLGPAPKWCSFLENLTEEMEDQTTRTAYQDYKFIDRRELTSLGLDHLVGTPALKPYMHGYFLSLQLYDTARVIANPYAYAEHREKMVREKMEKMAETRIRAKKDVGVKVNKALAERVRKEEEKEKRREERKKAKRKEAEEMDVDEEADDEEADEGEEDDNDNDNEADEEATPKKSKKEKPGKASLLTDSRFTALFDNPEFQIDENSREYALLHPSSVAQRQNAQKASGSRGGRTKTAVEEEEDESDKVSSDGLGRNDESSNEGSQKQSSESEDSDDAGALWQDDIRARIAARDSGLRAQAKAREQARSQRTPNVRLVPFKAQSAANTAHDPNATFGQRRSDVSGGKGKGKATDFNGGHGRDRAMEFSFVPQESGNLQDDDEEGAKGSGKGGKGKMERRKGVETFGAGMEKIGDGYEGEPGERGMSESERKGRTKRRSGMRSGSKNTFRRM